MECWSMANDEKLDHFLQILNDWQIGIACVTKTWFDRKNDTFSKTIKDAGFKLHHTVRESKREGGFAILYNRKFSVKNGNANTSPLESFKHAFVNITIISGQK